MNIFKGNLEFERRGDGAGIYLGKKLSDESGARPDQRIRVSIRKVNGECILTARWTPQYAEPQPSVMAAQGNPPAAPGDGA